jgi:hypothetical protein
MVIGVLFVVCVLSKDPSYAIDERAKRSGSRGLDVFVALPRHGERSN